MGTRNHTARTKIESGPLNSRDLYRVYGTSEPPKVLRRITKGPLSFLYSDSAIRQIKWYDTEVVRAVAWPIRDTSWGTYSPENVDANLIETEGGVSGRLVQAVDDGNLVCYLYFQATSEGNFIAKLTMTPASGSFTTNRAGLTVLHPIKDLAGAPVSVRHSSGVLEHAQFPRQISPDQPIRDIAGLSYRVGDAEVQIDFNGEVFEMEDQRNWSDASFKTYCVPLKPPFTYAIDGPITQSVSIRFSGGQPASTSRSRWAKISTKPTKSKTPAIGLAVEAGWSVSSQNLETVADCGVSHLLVRSEPTGDTVFSEAKALATRMGAEVDLEIILDDDDQPGDLLSASARNAENQGFVPDRVMALPRAYLDSHQPAGPWPDGPSPSDIAIETKRAFPRSHVGAGMLTNFTEFNRCRPDLEACDFISHGNSAIVHAGDDRSVVETLEALPHIFESARALGGTLPYRLGLVSIGMRSNPYGALIADNPSQVRKAMAREDPRQRGLFGAAWAVGVLSATMGCSVEALCLAAPSGPFGIVYEPQHYTQHSFDDGVGSIYPIYHVVRCAAQLAGHPRLDFSELPTGLFGYGARLGDNRIAMIANLTERTITARFNDPAKVSILDTQSFDAAVTDSDWIAKSRVGPAESISLGPFAIGFVLW